MATFAKSTYLNAKTGESITYDEFAFGVGVQDAMTQADSEVWHQQYITESASAKREWLHEWQHHYIMGNLKVSAKEADRILSLSKTKRTRDQQLAYKRANSRFGYHIVRKESTTSTTVKQTKVTVAQVLALYKQLDRSGKAEFKKTIG